MKLLRFFITGTDTGIGKTYVSLQLLLAFHRRGLSTIALKPLATGCEVTAQGLRNTDALALQQASSLLLPYEQINPVALLPAIAPHIAAKQAGLNLTAAGLLKSCEPALNTAAEVILVEGVGGWLVPLNANETMADFAKLLEFPVLLVIGIRLGCLNHALLSWQSLHQSNVLIAGWIANCFEPGLPYQQEQIATLQDWFKQPPLAIISHQAMT